MKISLQNRKKQNIIGALSKPEKVIGTCVIQHGYGGFKEQDHMQVMQDVFLKHGFQTFNFDATNSIGESDGDYEQATLGLHYEDFEDVTNWVQSQEWFVAPLAVIGHSMGGYAVARYAEDYPGKVAYCLPIAPVVSGKLTFDAHEINDPEGFARWKETGMLEKESESRPGYIKRQPWSHMEERLDHDLVPHASKLIMPTFLYVGSQDTSILPEHVKMLFDAIPDGNKTYIEAEGAPHTYRTTEDLSFLGHSIDRWLNSKV